MAGSGCILWTLFTQNNYSNMNMTAIISNKWEAFLLGCVGLWDSNPPGKLYGKKMEGADRDL